MSYVDPYVDYTGRVTGYAVVDLRVMGRYDWRLAETNVWKVERMLLDLPHHRIVTSDARTDAASRLVSGVSGRAWQEADRIRAPGTVDGPPCGIQGEIGVRRCQVLGA